MEPKAGTNKAVIMLLQSICGLIHRISRGEYPAHPKKRPLDVTPWLGWFLGCLLRAVQGANALLVGVLDKAQFWQRWAGTPMNTRQTLVINRVLDGFADAARQRVLAHQQLKLMRR